MLLGIVININVVYIYLHIHNAFVADPMVWVYKLCPASPIHCVMLVSCLVYNVPFYFLFIHMEASPPATKGCNMKNLICLVLLALEKGASLVMTQDLAFLWSQPKDRSIPQVRGLWSHSNPYPHRSWCKLTINCTRIGQSLLGNPLILLVKSATQICRSFLASSHQSLSKNLAKWESIDYLLNMYRQFFNKYIHLENTISS